MIRNVIWDWNGTLLNDVPFCVDITNALLRRYGLRPFADIREYRSRFSFPVKDYYASIGFGPEIFVTVAHEWMDAYMRGEHICPLNPHAVEIADAFHRENFTQVVISASKIENLKLQLASRPHFSCFCAPVGLNDIYAGSKTDLAVRWMRDNRIDPDETVFIGDTLHDWETAKAAGCRCILADIGHQSRERLSLSGCPLVSSLPDAYRMIHDME